MSQLAVPLASPSWGRATPRWSIVGHPVLAPASIAGLPTSSAWVLAGPPLSWSGPSLGSVLGLSVGSLKPHELSLDKLLPLEINGLLLEQALFATSVFLI